MDNPIELPRNLNATAFENATDFVRDYVYGVANYGWSYVLRVHKGYDSEREIADSTVSSNIEFIVKWNNSIPNPSLLRGLGYIDYQKNDPDNRREVYKFTSKAFELLDKPFKPTRIFISYKRSESSAFALLLEARLRLKGVREDFIFIDKSIPTGDLWEKRIRDEIKRCDYFISLVGQTTLTSDNVNNELDWAIEDGKSPIIICHNGMTASTMTRDDLKKYNGYDITTENALDYEQAVSHILNQLQYSTY